MTRPTRGPVALLLASVLWAQPAVPAQEAAVRVREAVVRADDEFQWNVDLIVTNPGPGGWYPERFEVTIEDRDPGETRTPRRVTMQRDALLKALPPLGPRDSSTITWVGPASAEHATLTFHLGYRRADSSRVSLTVTTQARPNEWASRVQADSVRDRRGRWVECVHLSARAGSGRAPAVLLVHGHGYHARHLLRLGRAISQRGYAVTIASQPGYGRSEGPADAAGPGTLDALEAALDTLRRRPDVDSTRVAVWGIAEGATAGALLAARRPDVRALVLQGGGYDLWASFRAAPSEEIRRRIVADAGKDSAGWRARSPLLSAARLQSPTLILHAERDVGAPIAPARAYESALRAGGAWVDARWLPGPGASLFSGIVNRHALEFLDRHLAP